MKKDLKDEILELRKSGLKYDEIRKKLNCSKSTVSYHCRRENLDDYNNITKISDEDIKKINELYLELKSCIKVAKSLNISKTSVLKYLKEENKIVRLKLDDNTLKKNVVKSVINWRRETKKKLVEYKGGKCEICNYNKCYDVLEFHHQNPTEKDFTISGKSWSYEKLRVEVDKCILVCANCHREIHFNLKFN